MAKRSFDNPSDQPSSFKLAQSVALETLIGKNLTLTAFSWEEGQQGTYCALRITDLETGQKYICGTRATVVLQQLQGVDSNTDCPFDFSVAKNNRSLSLVSVGDGGTYNSTDITGELPDLQS